MTLSSLKIVYFHSTEIKSDNILWGLLELGIDVTNPTLQVLLQEYSEENVDEILLCINDCDCVMTQNFSAAVGEAAHRKNIPYISWVYDSPQRSLYMSEVKYPTNFIFSFDKAQVSRIKEIGVSNIFYCPMAANITKASFIDLNAGVNNSYKSQISFVGNLYQRDYISNLLPDINELNANLPGFKTYIDQIALNWDNQSIYGKMPDNVFAFFSQYLNWASFSRYEMDHKYGCETLITVPMLAQFERVEVLKLLSQYYEVNLFTNISNALPDLGNTKVNPSVDNNSEAYKVFYHSKINLNITMRGIETGVPRRVFDIMSVGGFVLSNYQTEAEELFIPDKEIVLFHNLEELKDKSDFYLHNDSIRKKIAQSGFNRVRKEYTYPILLTYILKKVFS